MNLLFIAFLISTDYEDIFSAMPQKKLKTTESVGYAICASNCFLMCVFGTAPII